MNPTIAAGELTIRPVESVDEQGVVTLWRLVFPDPAPHNDPAHDVTRKLKKDPDLLLVAVHHQTPGDSDDDLVVGTAMAGFDGHRAAVWRVAVHPEYRGQKIGSRLMQAVEVAVKAKGAHKLNLLIREGNTAVIQFYEQLGYEIEPRTAMGKLL